MERLLPGHEYVAFLPRTMSGMPNVLPALNRNGANVFFVHEVEGVSRIQFVDVTGHPEGAIDGEVPFPDFPPVPRSFGRG